jgi:hypothetical protein
MYEQLIKEQMRREKLAITRLQEYYLLQLLTLQLVEK